MSTKLILLSICFATMEVAFHFLVELQRKIVSRLLYNRAQCLGSHTHLSSQSAFVMDEISVFVVDAALSNVVHPLRRKRFTAIVVNIFRIINLLVNVAKDSPRGINES